MHHCAFDPVSIEILREDLKAAYEQLARGEDVRLHAKTTSLKSWSEELVRYGRSDAAQSEASYWREQLRRNAGRLPIKPPAAGLQKPPGPLPIVTPLTEDETKILLQAAIPSFKATLDEILLAGLAHALLSQIGLGAFHVELLHHGRNHSFPNVDISRTVGWFSAEIPLLLDVTNAQSPNEIVEIVKEQVRGVPNRGIGYGVLRYMTRDSSLQGLPYPRIRFNNQGNFSQSSGEIIFSNWYMLKLRSKLPGRSGRTRCISASLSVSSGLHSAGTSSLLSMMKMWFMLRPERPSRTYGRYLVLQPRLPKCLPRHYTDKRTDSGRLLKENQALLQPLFTRGLINEL
jgi:hypothetical protein